MDIRLAKTAAFAVALLVAAAMPASAQTTYVVDQTIGGASDLNACTSVAAPCATINGAISKAASGDIVRVYAGVYPELIVINKPLKLRCANYGVAWNGARGAETTINPPFGDAAILIHVSDVTVDGCEIDDTGAGDVFAGIRLFNIDGADADLDPDDVSNVAILNNRVTGIAKADPGGLFNYAYGIQTVGGPTSLTAMASISDLTIQGNEIEFIGTGCFAPVAYGPGGCPPGSVAGAGMYLQSIQGDSAGDGATISGNRIALAFDGLPSATTAGIGGIYESGVGIAVYQDDDHGESDGGLLISGNIYDAMSTGVLTQVSNSTVSEDRDDFVGTIARTTNLMVVNLPHPVLSPTLPMAYVDPTDLGPFFASQELRFSIPTMMPQSIGYFKSAVPQLLLPQAPALDYFVAPGGEFYPVPSDETVDGADVTEDGFGNIFTAFDNGDVLIFPALGLSSGVQFTIKSMGGDDEVSISSDVMFLLDVVIDLGDGIDVLTINQGLVGINTIQHQAYDPHSGQYSIDGGLLTYFGLDPIFDNMLASNRVFAFTAGDDYITLGDDDNPDDDVSRIASNNSEVIDFINPSNSLVINAVGGADTVYLYPLDTDGTLTLPTIDVTVNGGLGADHFHVHPAADALGGYLSFLVNGGAPAICPGDELHVDAMFEADITSIGGGTIVMNGYQDINYTGIEAFPNNHADVEISVTPTLFPGDLTLYTVTVTNNGPDTAQCIVVDDALPAALVVNGAVTKSAGFLTPNVNLGPDWVISSLVNGGTATLQANVFVNSFLPIVTTVETGTTDDDLTNNSANVIGTAFRFPTGTVAQKALVYSYTVDDGVNGPEEFNRLIVGLYQGAPGLSGAVLCQIPRPVPGSAYYTVEDAFVANRWHQCSDGLPYPLHPNDLMQDQNGRIWLATWGHAGLYYSDNGGLTWEEAEPSLANVPTGWINIFAIAEDVNGFLYISANDGKIFYSLDGGDHWTQGGSLPWVDADTPWSLVADPVEPGVIYAGTFGRGVFVSRDFSQTWEPLGGDVVNGDLILESQGHIFDLEFSPNYPEVLFAATALGVFKIDLSVAPALWSWMDTGLRIAPGDPVGPEVRSLAFDYDDTILDGDPVDPDADLYVATWGNGVYRLQDPVGGPLVWDFFQLRNQEITFVATGMNGAIVIGTASGGIYQFQAATATANEEEAGAELPTVYQLEQNFPNPFNPTTTIQFAVPEAAAVRLAVFDLLGREVKVLVDGVVPAGLQSVQFDASGLPSGTYVYRLQTPASSISRTLVLLK